MIAALRAERIKLATTRAPVWSAVGVAVLSVGVAVLQGATSYSYTPPAPPKAALGVAAFGVPVLMILAALTVTGEYRNGLIRTTFLAVPRRTRILLAKAIVCAVFSGLYAALMVLVAVAAARLAADMPPGAPPAPLLDAGGVRLAGAVGLYAVLAAFLGVGVGALVRQSAGAVAVLLLWPLVAEPLLGNLPSVGPDIGPYLPFANIFRFLDVPWLYSVYAMPWGPAGSLVYFTVFVTGWYVAAAVLLNRRDA